MWISTFLDFLPASVHNSTRLSDDDLLANPVLAAAQLLTDPSTAVQVARTLVFRSAWTVAYEVAAIGFLTCLCGFVFLGPIVVGYANLRLVWGLRRIGPVRKVLSTVLVTVLGLWLYPVLVSCLLAMTWLAIGIGAGFMLILFPGIVVGGAHWQFFWRGEQFVGESNRVWEARRRRGPDDSGPDDISVLELIVAIAVCAASAVTIAPLVLLLTVMKAPFVYLATLYRLCRWIGGCYKDLFAKCYFGPNNFFVECGNCGGMFALSFLLVCATAAAAFAICLFIPSAAVGVVLSIVIKIGISLVWPAYVACGWLRSLGTKRTHRAPPLVPGSVFARTRISVTTFFHKLRQMLKESSKAAYQVLWAADTFTNCVLLMDAEATPFHVGQEFLELAQGTRAQLSPPCRRVSWLPPVVIGVMLDVRGRGAAAGADRREPLLAEDPNAPFAPWRLQIRDFAPALQIDPDLLELAWTSFFDHLLQICRREIGNDYLTTDYVEDVGPGVLIWAGSGRYRKDPQNPHRIFILTVFLRALLVEVVVCWYVSSRTWDTHRGRGLVCEIVVYWARSDRRHG